MKVLAIEMTSKHCKGVEYDLPEAEAVKGIQEGLFVNAILNALIDENAPKPEEQTTYSSDGSDKEPVVKTKK
jgi:hypothetical protein